MAGPRSGGTGRILQPYGKPERIGPSTSPPTDEQGTTTPPSPPDVGAVAGNSLPGAPPKYRSPIETPAELDEALAEQRPVQPGGAEVRGPVAPGEQVPPDAGRKDDQVVRIAFIDDLASWLVSHYVPAATPGRSGRLSASLQGANLRYGMGMTGLAWIGDDLPQDVPQR